MDFQKQQERKYVNANVDKIELFVRQQRPGWDCWGNESDGRRLYDTE